jgi:hypothetical protein
MLEMANNYGKTDHNGLSNNAAWELYDKNDALLITKIPGKDDYSLYKKGSVYYLSNEDKKYLGHIEISVSDHVGHISSSSSDIKGGFYNLMFTTILSNTDIKEIRSDTDLSDNAIKSYINLSVNKRLDVKCFKSGEYSELTKENLEKPGVVASVRLHNEKEMKEHFAKVLNRVDGDSVTYVHLKETKNEWLDRILFYEIITN